MRNPFWEVNDLLMTWWSCTIGSNASHFISPHIYPKAEVCAGVRENHAIFPVCHLQHGHFPPFIDLLIPQPAYPCHQQDLPLPSGVGLCVLGGLH